MHLIFKADTSAASSHTVQQHVSTTQRQQLLSEAYIYFLPSPKKEVENLVLVHNFPQI